MSQILVIDDEPAICWSFEQALKDGGHEVRIASTAEEALREVTRSAPDVIVLDYRLPGMDGLAALKQLRIQAERTPVILMTAFGSLDLAVDALGVGAFDYLPKPFDLDDAINVISRALADRDSSEHAQELPETHDTTRSLPEILGVSRGMQEVFRDIALVAPRDVPVLITGESGVGKELVARAIHRYSGRDAERFVPVCVPALSESVLESELFGHVKGAFTGADRDRPGLLEQAHHGTAFFDEIGDVPLLQQVKLLRVLEDRRIVPVGGNVPKPSSFRLIAATHRPLEERVRQGEFREDLYYRLSVFRIHIPPLRDRPEDIPELAGKFLAEAAGKRPLELSSATVRELQSRYWKGNVRELRSALQHAAVICRGGVVTPDCLPSEPPRGDQRTLQGRGDNGPSTPLSENVQQWAEHVLSSGERDANQEPLYESFLSEVEPPLFEAVLAKVGGNRKAAAEMLGLHRETLRKRLRKHRMDDNIGPDDVD